jgi:hypothetical protein
MVIVLDATLVNPRKIYYGYKSLLIYLWVWKWIHNSKPSICVRKKIIQGSKEMESFLFFMKNIKTFSWPSITMTQTSIIQKEILFLESKTWIFLYKVKVLNHLLCSVSYMISSGLSRIQQVLKQIGAYVSEYEGSWNLFSSKAT